MSVTHPQSAYRSRCLLVFSFVIAVLVAACAGKGSQPELAGDRGATRGQAAGAQESEIAKLKLAVLEKETQIAAFEKKYNEAVQEVVRTKAKLHSLESKAEAASTMAEAEIALKALVAKAAGQKDGPEIIQAGHLLQMSAQEFKDENYGGALYLASQAKGLVHIGQGRLVGREEVPIVSGEVLFALPLPLRVLAKSNVRQGPGLDFEVVFTVEKGALLVGHSYREDWVRVKDENGRGGWMHHALVGGRQESRQ
jgi:hypothetical protein